MDYQQVITALDFAIMEIDRVDPLLAREIAQIANQLEYDWLSGNKFYVEKAGKVRRRKKATPLTPREKIGQPKRLVYWN